MRVRPRIQGDGTPVAWSSIGSFKTASEARIQSEGEIDWEIDWDKIQQDHWQSIQPAA